MSTISIIRMSRKSKRVRFFCKNTLKIDFTETVGAIVSIDMIVSVGILFILLKIHFEDF